MLHAAQADIYVIPRIGIELQTYQTEFATGKYTSLVLELSLLHGTGVYFNTSVVTYAESASDEDSKNISTGDSKVNDRDEITFTSDYHFNSGMILFAGLYMPRQSIAFN